MTADLPRRIGFWGGAAIMVGIIIGSGIFRQPVNIAGHLGSPAAVLLLWTAGGALSLFGALTYAELGTMFPRSGGIYVYLHQGLGGPVAFIFGWTYMLIIKPFGAAGIAWVFAEHLNKLLGVAWRPEVTTCVMLTLLTGVNVLGIRTGAGLAMVLTGLKVLALAAIVGLAVALMKGDGANFAAGPSPGSFMAALAPVMAAVLWTYDGWSDVASVAGEVKEPQRRLPRILLAGTATVTALYLAVNAVYIWMMPLAEMAAIRDGTVAPVVVERLLGPTSGVVVTVLILVSTLGAAHGSIITGARVTFAQARDGLLFRGLGYIDPLCKTPDVSLWVQAFFSCVVVVLLRRFERLADAFVFTMWIFYGLAAAAVIVLRVRHPELERPYRCWGYPIVPILFMLAALAMTVLSIVQSPKDTLPWLAVLAAGAPAYWIWRRFASGATGTRVPLAPKDQR